MGKTHNSQPMLSGNPIENEPEHTINPNIAVVYSRPAKPIENKEIMTILRDNCLELQCTLAGRVVIAGDFNLMHT